MGKSSADDAALHDFVTLLQDDEDLQYIFDVEPVAAMGQFHVSPRDQKIILTKPVGDIKARLAEVGIGNPEAIVFVIKMSPIPR